MDNNNLKNLSCKSQAYYKAITAIEVVPVEEFDASGYLKYKKGDVITKKRFLKPARTTTVKEDLYRWNHGTIGAKEFACRMFLYYDAASGKFYRSGHVKVLRGKDYDWESFTSNADLEEFVRDLKRKCEECGNKLL